MPKVGVVGVAAVAVVVVVVVVPFRRVALFFHFIMKKLLVVIKSELKTELLQSCFYFVDHKKSKAGSGTKKKF